MNHRIWKWSVPSNLLIDWSALSNISYTIGGVQIEICVNPLFSALYYANFYLKNLSSHLILLNSSSLLLERRFQWTNKPSLPVLLHKSFKRFINSNPIVSFSFGKLVYSSKTKLSRFTPSLIGSYSESTILFPTYS